MVLSQAELNQAADIILQPGDIEVHHPFIIHGSETNTSNKQRAALPMRYIPTSRLFRRNLGLYLVIEKGGSGSKTPMSPLANL
ncbi:TPA: hypothetical protein EYG59_21015 [Candidatus Poribacteria bacterium]|nr:hypothetical protein [Candidatus Poribacteria bacterium]